MPGKKLKKLAGSASKSVKFAPLSSTANISALQEKYFHAIYTRNIPEINKCLEKGVNPNVLFPQTNSAPLHMLAERNDFVLGYRLMTASEDIDIDVVSNHGYTALHIACMFNSKKFAIMLLQMGANVNKRDSLSRTPMHHAVIRGSYSIIYNLIKYEANVNVMDCFENTPLSLSLVDAQNLLIANILFKYSNLEIEETKTSLHVYFQCILVCRRLEQIEFVTLLLDNGVKVNMRDKLSGRTCLHFVAITGYLELAIDLVERGADTTVTDKLSRTPFKVAVEHGNLSVADYFQKGYRPPHLTKVLPLVKKFVNNLRKRIAQRKEAEGKVDE